MGIPLPQQIAKNISEPFPCMHCGCGCTSAAMCWRECCCFSTEQKLAWAKKNDVRPPAFLVAEASKPTCCQKAGAKKSCFSTTHHEDDAIGAELANLKPCCRARALAARKADHSTCCHKPPEAKELVPLPGIIAIHALKCRGHSLTVSFLPPSVPADTIGAYLPNLPWEFVSNFRSNFYQSPSFDAVLPPPELAAI